MADQTRTKKNFTETDFDTLRESLKSYMEGQDNLQDYNFDGSVLSILLDVLAHNTQYNAVYGNMTAGERFLHTAQLRNSVVALARNLGYIPTSVKAAKATVTVSLVASGAPANIEIPAGTKFTAKNTDGKSLTFITRQAYYALPDGGTYNVDVDVYEGKSMSLKETFVDGQSGMVIPNVGIDTSLLTVLVRQSSGAATSTEYTLANDYTQVTSQSNVYFIEEVEGERHRVYFGEGVVGTQISAGNEVEVQYYKSNGSSGNDVSSFTLASSISGATSNTITTVSNSSGGADIETIDSIRGNAPYFYQAQNRAVTAQDYKTIVETQFSYIKDVSVWGGEDAVPPSYGNVFISAIPNSGTVLSSTRKNEISEYLESEYSVVTINTNFVDPDYLYLEIVNTVNLDTTQSTHTPAALKTLVTAEWTDYNDESLKQFNKNFRLSQIASVIDALDDGITSNEVDMTMSLRPPQISDLITGKELSFNNVVVANTVQSNQFTYDVYTPCVLKDDGSGNIIIYRIVGGSEVALTNTTGGNLVAATINYNTGLITWNTNDFDLSKINLTFGQTLEIDATPDKNDIFSSRNSVVQIDIANLNVQVVDQTTGITF